MLEIRAARPEERAEVASYLHRSFKEKIPLPRWQALIDGRWGRPEDSYGISLRRDGDLMGFLRKSLNNYAINLDITVNEEIQKRYAYTPREKYDKLLEINPLMDTLRTEFDLEI